MTIGISMNQENCPTLTSNQLRVPWLRIILCKFANSILLSMSKIIAENTKKKEAGMATGKITSWAKNTPI